MKRLVPTRLLVDEGLHGAANVLTAVEGVPLVRETLQDLAVRLRQRLQRRPALDDREHTAATRRAAAVAAPPALAGNMHGNYQRPLSLPGGLEVVQAGPREEVDDALEYWPPSSTVPPEESAQFFLLERTPAKNCQRAGASDLFAALGEASPEPRRHDAFRASSAANSIATERDHARSRREVATRQVVLQRGEVEVEVNIAADRAIEAARRDGQSMCGQYRADTPSKRAAKRHAGTRMWTCTMGTQHVHAPPRPQRHRPRACPRGTCRFSRTRQRTWRSAHHGLSASDGSLPPRRQKGHHLLGFWCYRVAMSSCHEETASM